MGGLGVDEVPPLSEELFATGGESYVASGRLYNALAVGFTPMYIESAVSGLVSFF